MGKDVWTRQPQVKATPVKITIEKEGGETEVYIGKDYFLATGASVEEDKLHVSVRAHASDMLLDEIGTTLARRQLKTVFAELESFMAANQNEERDDNND